MNFWGRVLQAQGPIGLRPCSTYFLNYLKMRKEASEAGVTSQAEEGDEITEEMDNSGSGWWRCCPFLDLFLFFILFFKKSHSL